MLVKCKHCNYVWIPRKNTQSIKHRGLIGCPMCHRHTPYDEAVIQGGEKDTDNNNINQQ